MVPGPPHGKFLSAASLYAHPLYRKCAKAQKNMGVKFGERRQASATLPRNSMAQNGGAPPQQGAPQCASLDYAAQFTFPLNQHI